MVTSDNHWGVTLNKAETCQTLVRPKLEAAGWDGDNRFYSEQTSFTDGVATPRYVCFYLLSPAGLFPVGEVSPGSADRSRTTGTRAMQKMPNPVAPYEQQLWFDQLYEKVEETRRLITESQAERSALLPAVLNQIFNGDQH